VLRRKKMKIEFPEEPVWEPLQAVVGSRCREFMFMGQIASESGMIFSYKHIWTRRYLDLDREGRAYRYTEEGYVSIDREEAIRYVFG